MSHTHRQPYYNNMFFRVYRVLKQIYAQTTQNVPLYSQPVKLVLFGPHSFPRTGFHPSPSSDKIHATAVSPSCCSQKIAKKSQFRCDWPLPPFARHKKKWIFHPSTYRNPQQSSEMHSPSCFLIPDKCSNFGYFFPPPPMNSVEGCIFLTGGSFTSNWISFVHPDCMKILLLLISIQNRRGKSGHLEQGTFSGSWSAAYIIPLLV